MVRDRHTRGTNATPSIQNTDRDSWFVFGLDPTAHLETRPYRPVMNSVRLMTANVFKEGATAEALAEVVRAVAPDILALQELTAPLSSVMSDLFPYSHLSPLPDGSGIAIGTTRAVSFEEQQMPQRNGAVATLQPDSWPEFGGPVELFNVHLASPLELLPWKTARIRRQEVMFIERRSSTVLRQVLCGDLNATQWWPAYRRLLRSYHDGSAEAERREGRRPARTWAPMVVGPRLLRIDHILLKGLRAVSTRAVVLQGSDHIALVADLVDDA